MAVTFTNFQDLAEYAKLKASLEKTKEKVGSKTVFAATALKPGQQREDIVAHCTRHHMTILRWEMVKGKLTAFVYYSM